MSFSEHSEKTHNKRLKNPEYNGRIEKKEPEARLFGKKAPGDPKKNRVRSVPGRN